MRVVIFLYLLFVFVGVYDKINIDSNAGVNINSNENNVMCFNFGLLVDPTILFLHILNFFVNIIKFIYCGIFSVTALETAISLVCNIKTFNRKQIYRFVGLYLWIFMLRGYDHDVIVLSLSTFYLLLDLFKNYRIN